MPKKVGRFKSLIVALLAYVAVSPVVAMAEKCAELATPSSFTPQSAMRAIFCKYNAAHEGTLIPLDRTPNWDIADADTLAKPHFTATYVENGVEKGVLVVARQMLYEGEPAVSHAQGAALSVYVFTHRGGKWVYEKGKKVLVDNAGSYGEPPAVELMRLGPEKYGLLFTVGFCNMGECEGGAFIAPISESSLEEAGDFDMSGDNDGQEAPNWSYEGKIEAVDNGGDDYLLRVVYKGTELVDDSKGSRIVHKHSPLCYRKGPSKYVAVDKRLCTTGRTVPQTTLFPGR